MLAWRILAGVLFGVFLIVACGRGGATPTPRPTLPTPKVVTPSPITKLPVGTPVPIEALATVTAVAATSKPAVTPVPSPTVALAPDVADFTTFARQVDQAVQEQKADFFTTRMITREVDCTQPREGMGCSFQMQGKKAQAILSGGWRTGVSAFTTGEIAAIIKAYLTQADTNATDALGPGAVRLVALGEPQDGTGSRDAVTTGIVQGQRTGMVFRFRYIDQIWRLESVLLVRQEFLPEVLQGTPGAYTAIPWPQAGG